MPTKFLNARPGQCRFIAGEPGAEAIICGEPAKDGSSYCPDHHSRCYRGAPSMRVKPYDHSSKKIEAADDREPDLIEVFAA